MESLRPRNSTSFSKELYDLLRGLKQNTNDVLQYHQRIAHDYVLNYPHVRGILAYQEMGSGKSILASSIAKSAREKYPQMKIMIITSKSLHSNMKVNMKKYYRILAEKQGESIPDEETLDRYIEQNYKFVSLNAGNMLKQVYRANKPELLEEAADLAKLFPNEEENEMVEKELAKIKELGNLDDAFIIIDEAHNFFNSIVHGSGNATGLYRLIMNARNIKLLFLTGSPIINDPFEVAVCYNMLAGKLISRERNEVREHTLFGEDYLDFCRYFVQNPENLNDSKAPPPMMKNVDKFANRITGLTSYYSTARGDIQALFPTLLELEVVRVPMSNKQYSMYSVARDREIEESKRGVFRTSRKPLQKPGGSVSSYRVRSRQISNFLYPDSVNPELFKEGATFKYEKNFAGLKPEYFDVNQLRIWGPKILEIILRISWHTPGEMLRDFRKLWGSEAASGKDGRGVGVVLAYSQFLDSGILVLAKALERYGFREVRGLDDALKVGGATKSTGTYCIISGEIDPEVRAELLKLAVSPENKHGEIITVLLFTATGAEGMDTKYARAVIAIEPYWHWARLEQVYARGVRLGSHMDLPEKERTVQPYLFLADYPLEEAEKSSESEVIAERMKSLRLRRNLEDTTDVTLYDKAIQNRHLIEKFLQVMRESSIDCSVWAGKNEKKGSKLQELRCRICRPTDRLLFIDDLDKDMRTASTCEPLIEQKIAVKSITLSSNKNVQEFKYAVDPQKQEVHIYQYNPNLDGYEEIYIEHPDYLAIYEAVTKKEKIH
jgi:hypothetical protein